MLRVKSIFLRRGWWKTDDWLVMEKEVGIKWMN